MGKKLTPEEFDIKLAQINPTFVRTGSYEGSSVKTQFKCKLCSTINECLPGDILLGRKCSSCRSKGAPVSKPAVTKPITKDEAKDNIVGETTDEEAEDLARGVYLNELGFVVTSALHPLLTKGNTCYYARRQMNNEPSEVAELKIRSVNDKNHYFVGFRTNGDQQAFMFGYDDLGEYVFFDPRSAREKLDSLN